MNQQQFDSINPQQRPLIAVAYLMAHADERPESTKTLFARLEQYDKQAEGINAEIKKAQKFVEESRGKIQQFIGAINATSEIISGMLPVDQSEVWCKSYDVPEGINIPQTQATQDATPASATDLGLTTDPDVAGSTSKTLQPVDVNALSKGQ